MTDSLVEGSGLEGVERLIVQGLAELDKRMDERLVEMQGGAFPTMLHHYTTIGGLVGIVESKQVWATSAKFLNDMSELLYGRSIVDEVLRSAKGYRNAKKLFLQSELSDRLFSGLFFFTGEATPPGVSTYLSCFCESPDLLSQWRGYGASGGYSLDFNGKSIGAWVEAHPGQARLRKVIYKPDDQRRLIKEFLKHFLDIANNALIQSKRPKKPKKLWDQVQDPVLERLIGEFRLRLERLIPLLKNPRFDEEREWRIVHQRPADMVEGVEFRIVGGTLVPYTKLPIPIDSDSLVSITCGPTPHGVQAMESMRQFCQSRLPWVQPKGTDVTLRL